MTLSQVLNIVEGIRKGTFTRIVYESSPTLTAEARKSGVQVVKLTEKVVRIGVDYQNIEAVKIAESLRTTPKLERAPWCHWEIDNILAKHNNKDDYYLAFASVNDGHHTKTTWFINGRHVTREEVEASGFIIPSYFKPTNDIPVVQKINITNIISLGGNRFS